MGDARIRSTLSLGDGHVYQWWAGGDWSDDRLEGRIYPYDEARSLCDQLRDSTPALGARYSHTLIPLTR
jgi:hypothetical protein